MRPNAFAGLISFEIATNATALRAHQGHKLLMRKVFVIFLFPRFVLTANVSTLFCANLPV